MLMERRKENKAVKEKIFLFESSIRRIAGIFALNGNHDDIQMLEMLSLIDFYGWQW